MNLKEITIEGYKSIGKITISNPNPFTVFVGPNASGKSNIFEGLEFFTLCNVFEPFEVPKLFGNANEILNQQNVKKDTNDKDAYTLNFIVDLGKKINPSINLGFGDLNDTIVPMYGTYTSVKLPPSPLHQERTQDPSYKQFFNFTRLFVGNSRLVRRNLQDDSQLNTDASNLEKVLKRILKDENKREEILEILHLLIPGFERVEIVSSELSGTDTLIIYETALKKPLTKELISDGTYNILAIIAALYQSDEPQFLCIEEPENGLNPMVIKEFVSIIRDICKEKGHHIWLNTHSQSLVSVLTTEEIILVDKVNGLTQIKQIQGMDLFGLRMDEALLTNSLGGGIPW